MQPALMTSDLSPTCPDETRRYGSVRRGDLLLTAYYVYRYYLLLTTHLLITYYLLLVPFAGVNVKVRARIRTTYCVLRTT